MGGAVRVLGAVRAVGVVGVVWGGEGAGGPGTHWQPGPGSLEILSKHIHKPLKVLEAV